jgi:hypothetical protein
MGWVDGARLWVFRRDPERVERVPTSPATYLTLHAGSDDHFAVVHHRDGDGLEVTVHHFGDLRRPLARAVVESASSSLSGDVSAWSRVPKHYTGFLKDGGGGAYVLARIDPPAGRVEHRPIAWFDRRYDHDSQSIMGATEVPGESRVLVSVQRSSRLILHDPDSGAESGHVDLANRGGNPSLRVRRRAREIWALDYDTIVAVEPGSWRKLRARRVQGSAGGTQAFAGGFAFDAGETRCVVARPFSGDVIALDPASLGTQARCKTGGQPLIAMSFSDGEVVARDWKTGDLLRGALKRAWW